MSDWFTKNLGDAMLAGEALDHVKALFLSAYEKASSPNDMAMFVRHESEGRLHCEVIVYFSPSTSMVAKAVDAIPCNRPSVDSLGLLVGPEEAWPVLFSGNGIQGNAE
jgi:hypothetical protein